MNYRHLILIGAIALSAPANATSQGNICIDGNYLVSSESRQIEIFDVNGNSGAGTYTMQGGQVTGGPSVVVNDSGYINVKYRNLTNGTPWVNSSLMHSGDCIKP
ncbi:MAG TPA: hypothetical protein VK485_08620 [Sphingomicrobium sp.]|nr:hypothetical protein [Sphingomicrobium sp.]